MSEELLRILLSELTTVRIKRQDDSILEVPLNQLSKHAEKMVHKREIHEDTRQALVELQRSIAQLCSENSDVEIEFSIPQNAGESKHGTIRAAS